MVSAEATVSTATQVHMATTAMLVVAALVRLVARAPLAGRAAARAVLARLEEGLLAEADLGVLIRTAGRAHHLVVTATGTR